MKIKLSKRKLNIYYSSVARDVTKNQTKKLSILLSLFFSSEYYST